MYSDQSRDRLMRHITRENLRDNVTDQKDQEIEVLNGRTRTMETDSLVSSIQIQCTKIYRFRPCPIHSNRNSTTIHPYLFQLPKHQYRTYATTLDQTRVSDFRTMRPRICLLRLLRQDRTFHVSTPPAPTMMPDPIPQKTQSQDHKNSP